MVFPVSVISTWFFLKNLIQTLSYTGDLRCSFLFLVVTEEIREDLKNEEESGANGGGESAALPLPRGRSNNVINAEKHYLPFELACRCQVTRLERLFDSCSAVSQNRFYGSGETLNALLGVSQSFHSSNQNFTRFDCS